MLFRLFLLFTSVTLIELTIIIWLYQHTGLGFTLLLVFGTGFAGAFMAKREGLRVLADIQVRLVQGQTPTDAMFDGVLILMAAAVLLTPGALTDLTGLALLLPPVRAVVKRWIKETAMRKVQQGSVVVNMWDDAMPGADPRGEKECEATRVEPDDRDAP